MTQRLIVTQGIPASGKSTWAREQVLKDPEGTVLISKDHIRNMLGEYWVGPREPLVKEMSRALAFIALNNTYNVIIDDTNLHPTHIPFWEEVAEDYDLELEVKRFDIDLGTALQRDAERGNKVGAEVLTKFYNELYHNPDNPYYVDPGSHS